MTFWQWLDKDDNWLAFLIFMPFIIISTGVTIVMVISALRLIP